MNLLAWLGRELRHGTTVFAATYSFAAILAAQLPTPAGAAEGTVLAGANVTFMASAEGSPTPTFQWHKNGNAIVGATSQILSFSVVTAADAGTYQVIATN